MLRAHCRTTKLHIPIEDIVVTHDGVSSTMRSDTLCRAAAVPAQHNWAMIAASNTVWSTYRRFTGPRTHIKFSGTLNFAGKVT